MLCNTIYALGSLPAGIASDRFGARSVITAGLAVFALFTAWNGISRRSGDMFSHRRSSATSGKQDLA